MMAREVFFYPHMSDDEYSSHSEIDELDSEDEKPSTSKGKGKGKQNDDYYLSGVLNPPRGTTYTPQALYGWFCSTRSFKL